MAGFGKGWQYVSNRVVIVDDYDDCVDMVPYDRVA